MENLTANEVRVIGCLMEKSVVTPDQYPLTLNALTNACNQKSARDPVMSLTEAEVRHTVHGLAGKHLVRVEENFRTGVEKYQQRFCNTTYSERRFSPAQFAIVCLLLLRGPQTPGELRARSGRLHTFGDNAAVLDALTGLLEPDEGAALVVKLPRTPGRKDSQYMHLLSGEVDVEAHAAEASAATDGRASERVSVSALVERIAALESEVAELKRRLDAGQGASAQAADGGRGSG